MPVAGQHGRIDPAAFARSLAAIQPGQLHRGQPAAVNLTQASDLGAVYPVDEIRAIAEIAKARGLKVTYGWRALRQRAWRASNAARPR